MTVRVTEPRGHPPSVHPGQRRHTPQSAAASQAESSRVPLLSVPAEARSLRLVLAPTVCGWVRARSYLACVGLVAHRRALVDRARLGELVRVWRLTLLGRKRGSRRRGLCG